MNRHLALVLELISLLGIVLSQVMNKITTRPNVHFITEDGKDMVTTYLGMVYKRRVKDLAIDLTSLHFVESLEVKYTATNVEGSKRIVAKYVGSAGSIAKECKKISNSSSYVCQCLAMVLSFEELISEIESVEIYGYDTMLNKFVGCYETKDFAGLETKLSESLQDCEMKCTGVPFYAMNSIGHCICVVDLPKVTPNNLTSCNESCPGRSHQLCGSSSHYSVYAKRKVVKTPPFLCLVTFENCSACGDEKLGFNCENIKCGSEDDTCGGMVCFGFNKTDLEDFQDCYCEQGYHMTDNLTCLDVNECTDPTTCDSVSTTCINLYGSYLCACNEGYIRKEDRMPKDKCQEDFRNPAATYLFLCILLALFVFALVSSAYFLYIIPARNMHEFIPQ